MLRDVGIHRALPFHGFLPAGSHDHGLGVAIQQGLDVVNEVLDDDGHTLADVVRVQAYPAHQVFDGGALVDLGLRPVLAVVCEPERQLVRRVVLQHIEDEAFLDGLAHGIDVERLRQVVGAGGLGRVGPAAEQLQGLGLRGGREGDIGDTGVRPGTGSHLRGQNVFVADFPAVGQLVQLLGAQQLLQLGRRFAGLAGMGFVGNHGKALALGGRQLLHLGQGEGEGLDGADDDLLAV